MVIENRKARFTYTILETFEGGLVLMGTEVKSLRDGQASLQESYAGIEKGELWIYQLHIPPYIQGNRWNTDPTRKRKVLMHRIEIVRLMGKVAKKGLTLVPLRIYFKNGVAKVELALAKGKKPHDKRDTIKKRDFERQLRRSDAA